MVNNRKLSVEFLSIVGQPYYSIYAYEYAGVDPQTGKELYYINGEDGSRETTTNSAAANKQSLVLSNLKYKAD